MDGIPTKIGRYQVERLLGTGAMGFVYLGVDLDLDRKVAIKTVRATGLEPEVVHAQPGLESTREQGEPKGVVADKRAKPRPQRPGLRNNQQARVPRSSA